MTIKEQVQQLEQEISNYEKIKERTSEQAEIDFCDQKITGFKEKIKELIPEPNPKRKRTPRPAPNNDIDFDFGYKTPDKMKKAKRESKGILDSIGDIFN